MISTIIEKSMHTPLPILPGEIDLSVELAGTNVAYKYLSNSQACESFINGNIWLRERIGIDFIWVTQPSMIIMGIQKYYRLPYHYHFHLHIIPLLLKECHALRYLISMA